METFIQAKFEDYNPGRASISESSENCFLEVFLHTIKLTNLKCTIWWILTNVCSHIPTPTINIITSPLEVPSCPFAGSLIPPIHPQLPTLACFLLLQFCFLKSHINGYTYYVVFCVWFLLLSLMLLRFTYE